MRVIGVCGLYEYAGYTCKNVVAVGMWLELSLCIPQNLSALHAKGLHAMVCKKALSKIARHCVVNDIIWQALSSVLLKFWLSTSLLD